MGGDRRSARQIAVQPLLINVPDLPENETNAPKKLYSILRLSVVEC
jgi:hypothetical protein